MLAEQKHTAQHHKPLVLSADVFLYRAPQPRLLDDLLRDAFSDDRHPRFRRQDICPRSGPGYSFYVDTPSMAHHSQPLWWHILAACLDDKPKPVTYFRKQGGGGSPLPSIEKYLQEVVAELLNELRTFPRGWTACPGYDF